MTVNANPVRDELIATVNGQTVFNYSFKIYSDQDLNVYLTPAGEEPDDENNLLAKSDYVVDPSTIGNESGGFITLNTGASINDEITIVSAIAEDRTVNYVSNGSFNADTVNADIDRTVSLVKQVSENVGRTISFQESQQGLPSDPVTFPVPDAGKFIQWNSSETGFNNVDIPSSDDVTVGALITLSGLPALSTDLGTGFNIIPDNSTNQGAFTALDTSLNDANNNITTNAADIATNASAISTNASNISTNASNISSNTSDIATNTSDIATLSGQIPNEATSTQIEGVFSSNYVSPAGLGSNQQNGNDTTNTNFEIYVDNNGGATVAGNMRGGSRKLGNITENFGSIIFDTIQNGKRVYEVDLTNCPFLREFDNAVYSLVVTGIPETSSNQNAIINATEYNPSGRSSTILRFTTENEAGGVNYLGVSFYAIGWD